MDRYKALDDCSNCEKITILNITPWEAVVHFFFEHDLKADTFLLDPPSMRLKPNEEQVGDGQRGQALLQVPRSHSSYSLNALSVFLLVGTGLGAEDLGVPHFTWPPGRQPRLLHSGEPGAGDLPPVLPRGARGAGGQPQAGAFQQAASAQVSHPTDHLWH